MWRAAPRTTASSQALPSRGGLLGQAARFVCLVSSHRPDPPEPNPRTPMPGLSRRSELIPFSPIRTMFRLAEELERAGGGPVFKLHVGDPDFTPPPAVVDAACDA